MGLFEILLIAVVTLLVVGPERMPEAVRSTALTIGRVKRMFNNARREVEKQVGADEIRQQLHNETVMEQLAKAEQTIEEGIDELTQDFSSQHSSSQRSPSQHSSVQHSSSNASSAPSSGSLASHPAANSMARAPSNLEDEPESNSILGDKPSPSS